MRRLEIGWLEAFKSCRTKSWFRGETVSWDICFSGFMVDSSFANKIVEESDQCVPVTLPLLTVLAEFVAPSEPWKVLPVDVHERLPAVT